MQNYRIPDVLYNLWEEFYCFLTVIIDYISIGATMYSSTSVRWIVHTLMPNRTYEWQPESGTSPLISPHIVAVNPVAVVAATNFNLDVGRYFHCVTYNHTFCMR